MGFGTETDEPDAFATLDRFVEAEGNLIDTSNVYGGGASEELIGRWFANRAADVTERVVLVTNARFGTGPDANEVGSSRRNLDRALSASLRWDPLTPIEETLSFLDDAVHAGKIDYIGLSNFTGWQMQLTLSTAKAMGAQVPVTLQQQYSLVSREIEYENVPAALHNNIGLLPWSPLAAGFLSGKYQRGEKAGSDTRADSGNPMNDHIFGDLAAKDQNWNTLDVVRDIAATDGVTPSQVAYSWVTNRPAVTAPIIGAKTLEQLEQNLGRCLLGCGSQPAADARTTTTGPGAVLHHEAASRTITPTRSPLVIVMGAPGERWFQVRARLSRALPVDAQGVAANFLVAHAGSDAAPTRLGIRSPTATPPWWATTAATPSCARSVSVTSCVSRFCSRTASDR